MAMLDLFLSGAIKEAAPHFLEYATDLNSLAQLIYGFAVINHTGLLYNFFIHPEFHDIDKQGMSKFRCIEKTLFYDAPKKILYDLPRKLLEKYQEKKE